MNSLRERLAGWIENRTGLAGALRGFLYEEIPASSGWHQVFGSVALFLFLTQAFTGILLAFNFAPTPGESYDSLQYIVTQVTCGRLFRGLHHWGASLMIVAVVLHMSQVFLYGAYKKPREVTWMVGVILLLLTLAFGLTGYLLPWDNRAYWGTVVSTQIAAKAPLIGGYLDRLLGGGGRVGVVTYARFYALHILLLPALLSLLVLLHVYLVRKHGVAPVPGDSGAKRKFFPEQVLKDTVAIFIAFVILYVMAIAVRVPLDRLADPNDTNYIPRPDWYFLFLFQALKFFKGSLEPVGSVILPSAAVLVLILVPFLDRAKIMRLTQRTVAFGVFVLAGLGWTALTVAAVATTPKSSETRAPALAPAASWSQLSPTELAGIGYFRDENCSVCHNLHEGPPKVGPNLDTVAERKSASWMIQHFRNPRQLMPGSNMPPIQLDDDQLNTLAALLLKLTPANAEALTSAPLFAVKGAQMFESNNCIGCHVINGVGRSVGPRLNGVSQRRSREWIEKHFADPQALSPGSLMPAFHFSPPEMDWIVSYLLSLPATG